MIAFAARGPYRRRQLPPRYRRLAFASFGILFTAMHADFAASAELPDALTAGWKGAKTCEKLFEDDKVRVGRCTFPPGTGHERHFHPPHYLYVLNGGKVRITDSQGTREVETVGGTFRSNARIEWHEVINIGDATLQYLIIEPK